MTLQSVHSENDSAYHGHEEFVSVCSLKNIVTFKDMFLKIRVTLASEEVRWEKTDNDDRLWHKYVWL
jgi:hypothetical protein